MTLLLPAVALAALLSPVATPVAQAQGVPRWALQPGPPPPPPPRRPPAVVIPPVPPAGRPPVVIVTPRPPGNPGGPPPRPPGRPGQPPGRTPFPGRRLVTPPARTHDEAEQDAARLMAHSITGLTCDQTSEAMRRLSNQILEGVSLANESDPFGPPQPGEPTRRTRREMQLRWRNHLRSGVFLQKVWDRAAEVFANCEKPCFDDGIAVGQISGAGYCAAAVGVGGILPPGFVLQPPLPTCDTSIFVGCQVGYKNAVDAFPGCVNFTVREHERAFKDSVSQDCHLDPAEQPLL